MAVLVVLTILVDHRAPMDRGEIESDLEKRVQVRVRGSVRHASCGRPSGHRNAESSRWV